MKSAFAWMHDKIECGAPSFGTMTETAGNKSDAAPDKVLPSGGNSN
jgi:hypothetical protein